MQDHPSTPGIARQGTLGTDGPAACGGAAAFSLAPGPSRPRATPLPLASDHARSHAASLPLAPGPSRPCATPLPLAPDHARSGATSLPLPNLPSHGLRDPAGAGPRVPLSMLSWPAGVRRLRSVVLHRVIATPGTRLSHLSTARFAPTAADPVAPNRPVPPRPPPTTAGTGYPQHRRSRAPPSAARRKPTLVSPVAPPLRRGDEDSCLRGIDDFCAGLAGILRVTPLRSVTGLLRCSRVPLPRRDT